jgi:hypothetical protein
MAVENAAHNSAYWRSKSEEAHTRADGMHDAYAVEMMLKVAHIYEQMALRAAKHERRYDPTSSLSGC